MAPSTVVPHPTPMRAKFPYVSILITLTVSRGNMGETGGKGKMGETRETEQ